MMGLGDPYEVPLHADVVIDASKTPAVRAARMVLDELIRRCGLPTVVAGGG
jgi:adenylylsulfate kinase-like enzyme